MKLVLFFTLLTLFAVVLGAFPFVCLCLRLNWLHKPLLFRFPAADDHHLTFLLNPFLIHLTFFRLY
jgi:hypothetical protein